MWLGTLLRYFTRTAGEPAHDNERGRVA